MLPSGWQSILVTATYRGADDTAPNGSVHLYTEQVVSGEGVTVVPRSFVADIDSEGSISIELPSPNYLDLGFTGLYYRVVERFPGGREPFVIYVPHDSAPIDLATAVPMVTPPELVSALSASVVQAAAAQAAIATTQATSATASATAAATNAASAASSAGTATAAAGTATAAATTATAKADAAAASATAAAGGATAAAGSASSASADATTASAGAATVGAAVDSASASASAAATSAANAAQSEADAHGWATQAGQLVSGVLHYMGAFDPAGGSFPAGPALGDFYKISGTGTIDPGDPYEPIDMAVGDQIIYNGATWDKIDNTEAVTSVAGRVGAVVITMSDLAGLAEALAAKLDATATAAAAAKLATPRTINGVAFDGTANITIGQLDAVNALAISAGAVAIDCALGDAFTLALTANVTAITFTNLQPAGKPTFAILKIKQDATGGRTIAWPSTVKWAGGTAYVASSAVNAVDTVGLMTLDAGTTWQGVASKGFA